MPNPWPDPRDTAPVRRLEIWLVTTVVFGGAAMAIAGWLANG